MTIARMAFAIGAITAAVLYVAICGLLFVFQRSLIYYPQQRSNRFASTLLSFPVRTGTVNVSTYPGTGTDALLYFGGNAEDVSRDIVDLSKTFPTRAVYALHYPGYGGSSGSPSQTAIFAASLELYDKVRADHSNIEVVGRSLGSGVAVYVASQRPVNRVVLITPFDSLGDVASAQYPFLPVRWLLRDKFESWRYAPGVTAPTKIIIAEQDELVPRSSSDRLRTRFRSGIASYFIVPEVGHNNIQNDPDYWNLMKP